MNKEELKKKLSELVDDSSAAGCWRRKDGRFRGKQWSFGGATAHRMAYRIFTGSIGTHGRVGFRKTLHILHKCDNPDCVNPRHLSQGTRSDNMRDMVSKGRHRSRWTGKLSAAQFTKKKGSK